MINRDGVLWQNGQYREVLSVANDNLSSKIFHFQGYESEFFAFNRIILGSTRNDDVGFYC